MRLAKDSRLVKWAYFVPPFNNPPSHTSLCPFFWRAFVFAPLFWGTLCGLVGYLSFQYASNWRVTVPGTIGVIIAVGCFVLLENMAANRQRERLERRSSRWEDKVYKSVFWQGLKTVKGKVCPLIELY